MYLESTIMIAREEEMTFENPEQIADHTGVNVPYEISIACTNRERSKGTTIKIHAFFILFIYFLISSASVRGLKPTTAFDVSIRYTLQKSML